MPTIAALAPSTAPVAGAEAAAPVDAGAPPASGPSFAVELASTRARLAALPTVRLTEMVAAAAGDTAAPVGAPAPGVLADTASIGAVAPGAGISTVGVAGAGAADGGDGAAVIRAGERYLGVPYKWGGTDPSSGLDCSGFVQRVFADLGVDLPRVSVDQSRQGTPVASLDEARPGDLVFWNGDGRRPNHIGIYAGDGRMLVAPRTGDVVRYQDITRTPHRIQRVL